MQRLADRIMFECGHHRGSGDASTDPDPAEPTASRIRRNRRSEGSRLLVPSSSLGFLVVLYFIQDRMIFPGAATQGTPQAVVRPRPGSELLSLPRPEASEWSPSSAPRSCRDGRPHPDPASRPALLYFYGNAMCLAYAEPEFERFRRLGLNVLIPDFLGFGMSGGKASEIGCRETALTALEASAGARASPTRGSSSAGGRWAVPSPSTWPSASRSAASSPSAPSPARKTWR